MMRLSYMRLHPEAQAPVYASAGAANFDLHAIIDGCDGDDNAGAAGGNTLSIPAGNSGHVRTGLAFEVPAGYVLAIYSRSGHGFKDGVRLSNCVGQIDSDYRGEVMIAVANDSRKRFSVRHGERIAQARLELAPLVELQEVHVMSKTARGAGGLGSTGA